MSDETETTLITIIDGSKEQEEITVTTVSDVPAQLGVPATGIFRLLAKFNGDVPKALAWLESKLDELDNPVIGGKDAV